MIMAHNIEIRNGKASLLKMGAKQELGTDWELYMTGL